MNDDPYIYRLPDGLMYAEADLNPVVKTALDSILRIMDDRVLRAEIVYEDILDAEVIE